MSELRMKPKKDSGVISNSVRRKVVLQGGVALTVSIPSRWAKTNNVTKGDEVNVLENGNSLMIYPKQINSEAKLKHTAHIRYNPESFGIRISNLYEKGYDEISVEFGNQNCLRDIEEKISNLIGFVVVEQKENKCLIRSMSKPSEEEFRNILRRNFLIVLTIANNILELVKKVDDGLLSDTISLEKTNKKLAMFSRRYILQRSDSESTRLYSLVKDLERVSSEYTNMRGFVTENRDLIDNKSLKLIGEVNSLLKILYLNYYNNDKWNLSNFCNKKQFIQAKIARLLDNGHNLGVMYNLIVIINIVYDSYIGLLS